MRINKKKYTSIFLIVFLILSNITSRSQNNRTITLEHHEDKSSTGKYHAIIISENEYADERIVDLNEPSNDAQMLLELLKGKYSFKTDDIIRLINPTRSEIYKAIEQTTRVLSPDDNLLIFYAGHGYWDETLKMGYWLPSDARKDNKSNWLSNSDLSVYLTAIQANHILLISDACFSGGIFKTRGLGGMEKGTKRLYELKSRKAITSGNLKEVPDNSIMMKHFLKELEQNQAQFLSVDQLFSKIRPLVLNNTTTEPLYGVIHGTGDDGGEFIFYNTTVSAEIQSGDFMELENSINKQEKRAMTQTIESKNKVLGKAKRAAILSFDNTSGKVGEFGDLGGPLRDMIVSDLSEVKNLSMVDRQALEKVLVEQKLSNSQNFDAATATRIGKLLGAEVIITGTYFEFFGSLRVDAKFIDVETGQIAFSVGVDGARDKLFELKNTLSNKIVDKLNN